MVEPREQEKRAGWVALLILAAATAALWLFWPVAPPPDPTAGAEPGWLPAVRSADWTCIVIHHSATELGGAHRFDTAHRGRGWDEMGYHFVIGNGTDTADGQVEVGSRWASQKHGAHCKTADNYFNQHGIGVCLVGNLENRPATARQIESLGRLTRFLCQRYSISGAGIVTHGQVTGQTRCPGRYFDLDNLRTVAAARTPR